MISVSNTKQGSEIFIEEVRQVKTFIDSIHLPEPFPGQPCLSSVMALATFREIFGKEIDASCSINVSNLSLNGVIENVGQAIQLGAKRIMLEGRLWDDSPQVSKLDPASTLETLRSLALRPPLVELGLQAYASETGILKQTHQVRPDFLMIRVEHDPEELEPALKIVAGMNTKVLVRLSVPETRGVGFLVDKVLANTASIINDLRKEGISVVLGSHDNFDEALAVLKKVKRP